VAGDEETYEDPPGPDDVEKDGKGTRYSRSEWRSVVVPSAVFIALVILVLLVIYLTQDTGDDHQRLDDLDESDNFNLLGHWVPELHAYGPYSHPVNLTLEVGDQLVLTYTTFGPPGGIQVRLQHPLHPTDGVNGTGGTEVYSSAVGENGSIRFTAREGGAYQVYFWHPGSVVPPGPSDDPNAHITAAVSYHLQVTRALRP
jgi:hypothetical protein